MSRSPPYPVNLTRASTLIAAFASSSSAMSFSALPVELKERIVHFVRQNDAAANDIRTRERETGELFTYPVSLWIRLFGRGVLTLSKVNKELRALVLPGLVNPFDLAKVSDYNLGFFFQSTTAACCHTLILNVPGVSDEDTYGEGYPLQFRRSRAIRAALALLPSLPRLRSLVIPGTGMLLMELVRCLEKDLYYPDEPEYRRRGVDKYWDDLDSDAEGEGEEKMEKSFTQHLLDGDGSSPDLVKLLGNITALTLPGNVATDFLAGLVAVSAPVVRDLTITRFGDAAALAGPLAHPEQDELASALASCVHLDSLSLSVRGFRYFIGGPVIADEHISALGAARLPVTRLSLLLNRIDDSLLTFLQVFPVLYELDITLDSYSDDVFVSGTPPVAILALSSLFLRVPDLEAFELLPELLRLLSLPSLDTLTLELATPPTSPSEIDTLASLLHRTAPALSSLRLSTTGEGMPWPAAALRTLRNALAAGGSSAALTLDWPEPKPEPASPPVEEQTADSPSPLSSSRQAHDLVEWMSRQVAEADRTGDEGLLRMLLEGAKDVQRLRRFLDE
ncbi:hypothetical protein JCM8097_003150 [Rhodosporidiobolus ruineniae]